MSSSIFLPKIIYKIIYRKKSHFALRNIKTDKNLISYKKFIVKFFVNCKNNILNYCIIIKNFF
jgi:hypothetical protein